MKFMHFTIFPVEKGADVAAVSDKVWANVPQKNRPEANYLMLCIPQFNIPPNSLVVSTITEDDSAEAIAARVYPLSLAGATIHSVPLLDMPIVAGAKTEKKYRG